MLLTIRNKGVNADGIYAVQLSLSYSGQVDTYLVERYAPVVNRHLKQSLSEYCLAVVGEHPMSHQSVNFGEKYLSVGYRIADQLMGDDFQLNRFREIIEDIGYAQLDVVVESFDAEFLDEVWDSLILPGSKYILSTVAQSFRRTLLTQRDALSPLNDSPDSTDEAVVTSKNMLRSDTLRHEQSIRILYGVSRPRSIPTVFPGSDVMRYLFDSLSSEEALSFDIRCGQDVNATLERCTNKAFDIFHYDGPVLVADDGIHFVFEAADGELQCVDMDTMAATLAAKGITVIFLQVSAFYLKNEDRMASFALSDIAASLLSHQIDNVVGFPLVADPEFNRRAYQTLYQSIAAGIPLSSAMVEVRKKLQSHLASNSADARLMWSAPVLYSAAEFRFSKVASSSSADAQQEALPLLRKKLFGFQSEMLPPLLSNVSDGVAFDMIHVMHQKRVVLLSGGEGIGKCHTSHMVAAFLALQKQIDFAFYFDSRYVSHSVDDICQMITSVFVGTEHGESDIKQILKKYRCLYVFDRAADRTSEIESAKALAEFINDQLRHDNHVIVIGDDGLSEFIHSLQPVSASALPTWAQHILLANEQQRLGAANPLLTIESPLVSASRANPWLMRKLLPQRLQGMSEGELSELAARCHESGSIKQTYFEWQWRSLSPCARFLLRQLGEQPGTMLELLMIVFERENSTDVVRQFKALCADAGFDFSRFLQQAEHLGLLKRLPHARFIDTDLSDYLLHSPTVPHEKVWESAELLLCFSQLISEGVRAICGHVLQAHNPHILNNLLIHRRIWASHLERLYKNADFQRFFLTRKALDAVLQFAGLNHESHAWALTLLERYPIDAMLQRQDYQSALAWCTLALSVNRTRENLSNATLIRGAQSMAHWLETLPLHVDDSQTSLFRQGIILCDLVQRSNRLWPDCIKLMTKVLPQFYEANLADDVKQALRSLVHCYTELGEFSKAVAFEDQLLAMMAATATPEQSSFEQTLELVTARLMRGDHAGAEKLLQQMQQQEQPEPNRRLMDALQNEIGFRQGRYADVLPYYCQAWAQAVRLNLQDQLEKLRSRLQVLESELGTETVLRFLREKAPDVMNMSSPVMTVS